MPLLKGKSKKAFSHNVKAEMDAGKPQDQSLAIAYATKRRSKMAHGGEVKSHQSEHTPEVHIHMHHSGNEGAKMMADGGEVDTGADDPSSWEYKLQHAFDPAEGTQHPIADQKFLQTEAKGGLVDRVMQKRAYSQGGKVANENSGESTDDPTTFAKADSNEFDDLALDDDLSFNETGANSGDEDGSKLNQEDDFIERVMKKRAKGMPGPMKSGL